MAASSKDTSRSRGLRCTATSSTPSVPSHPRLSSLQQELRSITIINPVLSIHNAKCLCMCFRRRLSASSTPLSSSSATLPLYRWPTSRVRAQTTRNAPCQLLCLSSASPIRRRDTSTPRSSRGCSRQERRRSSKVLPNPKPSHCLLLTDLPQTPSGPNCRSFTVTATRSSASHPPIAAPFLPRRRHRRRSCIVQFDSGTHNATNRHRYFL